MFKIQRLAVLFLSLALWGCGTVPRYMEAIEKELGTGSGVEPFFHSTLYYPKGIALHYSGFVLAMEKATQEVIGGPKVSSQARSLFTADHPYFLSEKRTKWGLGTVNSFLNFQTKDTKAMFVSHLVEIDQEHFEIARRTVKSPECFLYNAYAIDALNIHPEFDVRRPQHFARCADAEANLQVNSVQDIYVKSRDVLDLLASRVSRKIARSREAGQTPVTDVVVIVMGWNTNEEEAVRNFNDIVGNLVTASQDNAKGSRFNPLVIGVTWPSYWTSSLLNFFSYPNKAKDADELGYTWLNYLFNDSLRKVKERHPDLRLTAIGHSFGARAVSRGLFSSPALPTSKAIPNPQSSFDFFFGLQGAFSINRFHEYEEHEGGGGDEGAPYRAYPGISKNTKIVLTASRHDGMAGGPIFWFDPSGSIKSYKLAANTAKPSWYRNVFSTHTATLNRYAPIDPEDKVNCPPVQPVRPFVNSSDWIVSINPPLNRVLETDKILYIDTSCGITTYNSLGTNGGAHSDIYRLPMGKLIWEIISSREPNRP